MTAGSAGDDPQAPAAAPAGLDLDAKNRSAQVIGAPLCGRSLSRLRLRTACQALLPLADPGDVPAQPAVGCEDAVVAGQLRARLRHQYREPATGSVAEAIALSMAVYAEGMAANSPLASISRVRCVVAVRMRLAYLPASRLNSSVRRKISRYRSGRSILSRRTPSVVSQKACNGCSGGAGSPSACSREQTM